MGISKKELKRIVDALCVKVESMERKMADHYKDFDRVNSKLDKAKKEFEQYKLELETKIKQLEDENFKLKTKIDDAILAVHKDDEDEKKFKDAMDEYLKPII